MKPIVFAAALAVSAILMTGCGYHVQGHNDTLPATIKTIYIPAWKNASVKYKLSDLLPQDIAREFVSRTRFRVVTRPEGADAVLSGTILKYRANPAIFDPTTSRASVVEFEVALAAKLTDSTGKTLWENNWLPLKGRYEISSPTTVPSQKAQYFEESDPGITRLSREAARTLVDAILSSF